MTITEPAAAAVATTSPEAMSRPTVMALPSTPFLEVETSVVTDRLGELAAALPGTRSTTRSRPTPTPVLPRLVAGRLQVRRRQPDRGARLPRRRRGAGRPRLLQPGQAARPRRGVGRPRRPASSSSTRRRRSARSPRPRPVRPCSAASSPPATAPTGRCPASTAARSARPWTSSGSPSRSAWTPAGVCFHVGSQQRDPNAWRSPIAAAATRVRGGARRRALPVAARPRRRVPRAARGRAPAARRVRRAPSSDQLRQSFGDAPTADHRRAGPGRRRRRRRTGRRAWSAWSTAADTRWVYLDAGVFTGLVETLDEAIRYRHRDQRRRRPDRPVRARGADLRQRRRALRGRRPCTLPLDARRGRHRPPRVGRRLHLAATRPWGSTGSTRCRSSSADLASGHWSASSRRAHRPSTESTSSWAIRPGEAVAATTRSPTSSISSRRASSVRSPQSPPMASNPKEERRPR